MLYEPSSGKLQKTVRLLAESLAWRGFEVTVYTSQASDAYEFTVRRWRAVRHFPSKEIVNGVHIRRFDFGGVYDSLLNLLYRTSTSLQLPETGALLHLYRTRGMRKGALLKEVARFKPDVILAAPDLDFILSIATEAAYRLPAARLFVHTALPAISGGGDTEKLLKQLSRADAMLVETENQKEFLISRGLDPGRVVILSDAPEQKLYDFIRRTTSPQ